MSDKGQLGSVFKNVNLKPDSIAINCADTGNCRTYFQLKNDANNWRSLIAYLNISFVAFLGRPSITGFQ